MGIIKERKSALLFYTAFNAKLFSNVDSEISMHKIRLFSVIVEMVEHLFPVAFEIYGSVI